MWSLRWLGSRARLLSAELHEYVDQDIRAQPSVRFDFGKHAEIDWQVRWTQAWATGVPRRVNNVVVPEILVDREETEYSAFAGPGLATLEMMGVPEPQRTPQLYADGWLKQLAQSAPLAQSTFSELSDAYSYGPFRLTRGYLQSVRGDDEPYYSTIVMYKWGLKFVHRSACDDLQRAYPGYPLPNLCYVEDDANLSPGLPIIALPLHAYQKPIDH